MEKNFNIIDNISILIYYVITFFLGTTMGAVIEYLGNPEAIKLCKTNKLKALEQYFHYSTFAYECGLIMLIFGGVFMFFLVTHKILFFKLIERKDI